MLLADRGVANQELMQWLGDSSWHYAVRWPCDVLLHGASRYPDGAHGCNLVLATVLAAQNAWAVATDAPPSLQTLWDDALRFCVEELFGDSKSGAFELSDSRLRSTEALERLYLVAAIALLYAPLVMAVQLAGLRQQVDPHYKRGISYLKIGLRWLNGVLHKGRPLLVPSPFLSKDPQPCFASHRAREQFYDQFWFSRILSMSFQP
jgi:hypothetical protein